MTTVLLYTLGVIVFILAIFASIALHELGHLKYAKRYGCRVSEYMIGFGPRLFSWTRGETEYGVKLIPLGGYVKIIGMFPPDKVPAGQRIETSTAGTDDGSGNDESGEVTTLRKSNTGIFAQMVSETRASAREEIRPEDEDRLFYKLPWHQKVMTMLAGPGTNIVIAFLCLQGVYAVHGVHSTEPTGNPVVSYVSDCVIPETAGRTVCQDSDPVTPAKKAGMEAGDTIVSINGEPIQTWDEVQSRVHAGGDAEVTFVVERDGEQITLEPAVLAVMVRDVSANSGGDYQSVGFLGVRPEHHEVVTRGGPIYTMQHMGEMTANAVSSIADLPSRVWNVAQAIVGNTERDENGPVSIVGGSRIAGEVASADEATTGLGASNKVALLALIVGSFNLFIGLFNLIPLMPLDGGHIAGALWEQIRRVFARIFKRADPGYVDVAKQMPVAYIIGGSLLVMGVVLIIGDILVPISIGL